MWDNVTPLKLLESMPKVLEDEHLEKLQMLLEADKYKNQLISGNDLCGTYAPFCFECDKGNKFPCAVAYVKFMKSAGMEIEIASDGVADGTETQEETSFEKPATNKIRIAVARKKTLL